MSISAHATTPLTLFEMDVIKLERIAQALRGRLPGGMILRPLTTIQRVNENEFRIQSGSDFLIVKVKGEYIPLPGSPHSVYTVEVISIERAPAPATPLIVPSLHTFLYRTQANSGYELVPYVVNGQIEWHLVAYRLFPKHEVARVIVQRTTDANGIESYIGENAQGQLVIITIDPEERSASAPYSLKVQGLIHLGLDPLWNFDSVSEPNPAFAQRINPSRPDLTGGGLLGTLGKCANYLTPEESSLYFRVAEAFKP